MKSISFSSLKELCEKSDGCDLNEWVRVKKESGVYFLLISEMPFLKVLCHVAISENLSLSVHVNDIQIARVGDLKFPVTVSNTTQLTSILNILNLNFSATRVDNIRHNVTNFKRKR